MEENTQPNPPKNLEWPKSQSFSFYRAILKHPIIRDFQTLMAGYPQVMADHGFDARYQEIYFHLKSKLLEYSFKKDEDYHYAKTPWKDYVLSEIISDENPLNLLFERGPVSLHHPFISSMLGEFQIFLDLYHFDWAAFLTNTGLDEDNIFDSLIFFTLPPHNAMGEAFETRNVHKIFGAVNQYIHEYGLGIFENNVCFKINREGHLSPIPARVYKSMDALIGYDRQKNELIANTASFIQSYTGLNVLLQGDMGTGKSTMVKALLDTFSDTKLRMIEFKKDEIALMPSVISKIKDRPYPFILFIDDLSFDDKEGDFKLFKNILEGSLEDNPKNVLIYATSNKRHLVTETMSERTDAVHTKDIMEEKLSLSSRFGLVLTFGSPDQKEYLNIVNRMAEEAGIDMPQAQLETKALQWELRHLNRSGRTAEQFIEYLLVGKHKNKFKKGHSPE